MTIHVDQRDRPRDSGYSTMPHFTLSQSQREAADFLERCADDLVPLAALTGGSGCGKTVTLNAALARSERLGLRVVRVHNFVAGPLSLHRLLAASLGVADAGELSAEALEPALRKALAASGQSEPPVIAVDDAQSLLPETLRYLCLLASLREKGQPLFRILLVGRPGFAVRQSMPVQFTLEPMRPDDAHEAVRRGLEAAGLRRHDDTAQEIARTSQGNWRTIGLLLNEHVNGTRGIAAVPNATLRSAAAVSARPPISSRRRAARSSPSPFPVLLAGLIVVAAAGATIAFQQGLFADHPASGGNALKLASNAPAAHPNVPRSINSESVPTPPLVPAPPLAPAPPSASVQAPATTGAPAPVPSAAPIPLPAPAVSVPAAGPSSSASFPPATAPAKPEPPATTKPADLPALSTTPVATPPVPPGASAPADAPAAPVVSGAPPAAAPGRSFRLYNISSCHHSVCPRWAVFDVQHRTRFVAAFDPTSLHLDPETVQRLREGVVDLTVRGTVAQGGPDGHVLDADQLESIEPHRPRIHQDAAARESLADPAPLTQSPPPGYLSLPADRSPVQLAPPPLAAPIPLQ